MQKCLKCAIGVDRVGMSENCVKENVKQFKIVMKALSSQSLGVSRAWSELTSTKKSVQSLS